MKTTASITSFSLTLAALGTVVPATSILAQTTMPNDHVDHRPNARLDKRVPPTPGVAANPNEERDSSTSSSAATTRSGQPTPKNSAGSGLNQDTNRQNNRPTQTGPGRGTSPQGGNPGSGGGAGSVPISPAGP